MYWGIFKSNYPFQLFYIWLKIPQLKCPVYNIHNYNVTAFIVVHTCGWIPHKFKEAHQYQNTLKSSTIETGGLKIAPVIGLS